MMSVLVRVGAMWAVVSLPLAVVVGRGLRLLTRVPGYNS